MENKISLISTNMLRVKTADDLRKCNKYTEKFGLALTEEQILSLVEKRFQSLSFAGRVEFGEGVISKLITAFCDSPYLNNDNYEEVIADLQDTFYSFKNASNELVPDDDLISRMKICFDTVCRGSIELLNDLTLDELLQGTKCDPVIQDEDTDSDLKD